MKGAGVDVYGIGHTGPSHGKANWLFGRGPAGLGDRVDGFRKAEICLGQLVARVVGGDAELDPLPREVHVGVMADLTGFRSDVHGQVDALVVSVRERPDDLIARAGPAGQFREAHSNLSVGQWLGHVAHATAPTISRNSRPADVRAHEAAYLGIALISRRSLADPVTRTALAA